MSAVPANVPLQCRCGRVRGVARDVSPREGLRFVCYCRDCQAFARFLERADVLDAAGGTEIYQMAAGRVRLSEGSAALRCIRLSNKVLRWYTDCCRTPIGNTATTARFPVVAVIHTLMDPAFTDQAASGLSRTEVLGPPLCRLFENSAIGPLPLDAPPPHSLRIFARRASLLFGWWKRGVGKPSPFFDERTGAPRAEPRAIARHA